VLDETPLLERLTASDLFMLLWDDYGWSTDIGGLAILDGTNLLVGRWMRIRGWSASGPYRTGHVGTPMGTSGHDEDQEGQITAPSCSVPLPPASSRGRFESHLLRREDPCRLPCRRPRPGCVRLGLELAVDPDVGPLVVEADQVLDLNGFWGLS
jgi:hypothetical protein